MRVVTAAGPDDCAGIPAHQTALLGRLDCPDDDPPAADLLRLR